MSLAKAAAAGVAAESAAAGSADEAAVVVRHRCRPLWRRVHVRDWLVILLDSRGRRREVLLSCSVRSDDGMQMWFT